MKNTKRIPFRAFVFILLGTAAYSSALTIEVSTVRELLQAIGPDREVILSDGTYDISDAVGFTSPYLRWEEVYDGAELIIRDVKGLILKSDGVSNIVTGPRYANVLTLYRVSDIILENLTLGHTEAGECSGGVLRLSEARNIEIRYCSFFGSGVIGIEADGCEDLLVVDSEITGCSYGAIYLSNCSGVYVTNSLISDNEGHPLFLADNCDSVEFEDCTVRGNSGSAVFTVSDTSSVGFSGGSFIDNAVGALSDGAGTPEIAGAFFEGNGFPGLGTVNEVVVEFAGAAFLIPDGWEHELHHDNPGSATFESPDGNAFGFFLPLNKKATAKDARAFAAAKSELEKQLRDNVKIRLSLKAEGGPYAGGDIRRQDLRAVHSEGGVQITVRAQILIVHDFFYALCLFWRGEDGFDEDADYIFDSVTLLDSVG